MSKTLNTILLIGTCALAAVGLAGCAQGGKKNKISKARPKTQAQEVALDTLYYFENFAIPNPDQPNDTTYLTFYTTAPQDSSDTSNEQEIGVLEMKGNMLREHGVGLLRIYDFNRDEQVDRVEERGEGAMALRIIYEGSSLSQDYRLESWQELWNIGQELKSRCDPLKVMVQDAYRKTKKLAKKIYDSGTMIQNPFTGKWETLK